VCKGHEIPVPVSFIDKAPLRSEEGLCLITSELIFDMFDICIERDKWGDINYVFGSMISDLVKELETWKEVALFADVDLILTTGRAGTSRGPLIRPVYSPCQSLCIRNRASQNLHFTIEREKLKSGLSNINKTARSTESAARISPSQIVRHCIIFIHYLAPKRFGAEIIWAPESNRRRSTRSLRTS
jgi:hypothetical protein